jgi:hypothetical protein
MSATTTSIQTQKVAPISKLWWVGLVAAGTAALGNVVFYLISRGLGVSYLMPVEPGSSELAILPVGVVIFASAVPAVVATILYAILGKFLARPITVFWIISAVVLLLSMALPLVNLPATVDNATVFALEVMHVIAAVATVGVLTTLGREK